MGILGIFLPVVFSVLAIIFGVQARTEIDRNPGTEGKGKATAGTVLGIIGFVGLVASWIVINAIVIASQGT